MFKRIIGLGMCACLLSVGSISNMLNMEEVKPIKPIEVQYGLPIVAEENTVEKDVKLLAKAPSGPKLTRVGGKFWYEGHKETYYNLNMGTVVYIMENLGYSEEYWVRDDGVKMYGEYVMVAANTNAYPKGTIVGTSLGKGMVVDCCESACSSGYVWFDIAVTW